MKDLFKIALAAALAAVIVDLARRFQLARVSVPTLRPVQDASPTVEEPLHEDDLRVARNLPF